MGESEAQTASSRSEALDATPPLFASEQQTESTPLTAPATDAQVGASASDPPEPLPEDARVARPLLAATSEPAGIPPAAQEAAAGTVVEGAAGVGGASAAPAVAVNGGSEATPLTKDTGPGGHRSPCRTCGLSRQALFLAQSRLLPL